MKKILRTLDTPENRAFWESAERIAKEADSWPDSKLAGINVAPTRSEPLMRSVPDPSQVRDRRHIALVDMDGTLADFDGSMAERMASLRSPLESEALYWDESLPYIKARRDMIKNTPGFWQNLKVIPDGLRILNLLEDVGFAPHILTKGPRKALNAFTEKMLWCRTHVPNLPVTLAADKGMVYGRVLVDDWPPYIRAWLEWRPRGLVLMPCHPWNEGLEHPNVLQYRHLLQEGASTSAIQAQDKVILARLKEARDR